MKNKGIYSFEFNCLIYFLVRASFIGILSNNLMRLSGIDGWISIIIGCLFGLIPLFLYYLVMRIDTSKNIFEITRMVLGRIGGDLVNYLFIVFIFVFCVINLVNLIGLVNIQYLNKTPIWAISLLFSICFYYICSKNFATLSRLSVILFYASIVLLIMSCISLISQIELSNINPIMALGFNPVFNGSIHFVTYSVLPILLLGFIPLNKIKNFRIKSSIMFYLLACTSIFLVVFSVVAIYGIELAKLFPYPEFQLLKKLSLSGFLGSGESILGIQWILDLIIFISLGLNFIKNGSNKMLVNDYNNFLSLVLVLLIYICSLCAFDKISLGGDFLLVTFPTVLVTLLFGSSIFILLFHGIRKHLLM